VSIITLNPAQKVSPGAKYSFLPLTMAHSKSVFHEFIKMLSGALYFAAALSRTLT
jgi:hypothetical protein